jgi:hypothetical protein
VTDWSNRTTGTNPPNVFTFQASKLYPPENRINLENLSGDTLLLAPEFEAAIYHLHVFNPAAGVRIEGGTAYIDVDEENQLREANPGWLFSWTGTVSLNMGETLLVEALMVQQVKQLSFVLMAPPDFAAKIDHIDADLYGVASQVNLGSGENTGAPCHVRLNFEKQSDSVFVAQVKLLGVIGNSQLMTNRIFFNDSEMQTIDEQLELHPVFADFNADKITPMLLLSRIIPYPEEPGQGKDPPLTGDLSPWENVYGDPIYPNV